MILAIYIRPLLILSKIFITFRYHYVSAIWYIQYRGFSARPWAGPEHALRENICIANLLNEMLSEAIFRKLLWTSNYAKAWLHIFLCISYFFFQISLCMKWCPWQPPEGCNGHQLMQRACLQTIFLWSKPWCADIPLHEMICIEIFSKLPWTSSHAKWRLHTTSCNAHWIAKHAPK